MSACLARIRAGTLHALFPLSIASILGREHAQAASVELEHAMTPEVMVPKARCHGLLCAQVPMYSASGLRVLYLRVWERGDYKVDKWVRKVARSGSYEIRA